MNDLISRQAAIKALKQQAETMSEWHNRYAEQRKGVLTAVNIVEDLPPAPAVKVALSLLVDRFENVLSEIREINGDDTVCKWCEYNGAYIGESGNWDNVCTGFDSENCFKLKDSYRKELESIYG